MNAILIFLGSLGIAYTSARLNRRRGFDLTDLLFGLFSGCAGLVLARLLGIDSVDWRPGLPLFVACALTLGLESLPHRKPLR
ncbi:MAG TPA: hypothetical protein VFU22_14415 [Roseiflexaceae bacterium]|nr:hypothetical protein [Roseiflexaceae bacterium]